MAMPFEDMIITSVLPKTTGTPGIISRRALSPAPCLFYPQKSKNQQRRGPRVSHGGKRRTMQHGHRLGLEEKGKRIGESTSWVSTMKISAKTPSKTFKDLIITRTEPGAGGITATCTVSSSTAKGELKRRR